MDYKKLVPAFLFGVLITSLLFLLFRSCLQENKREDNDYYVITNQIRKMNKLVVMEQDFSTIQRTKMSTEILGGKFLPSMNKELVTFTKTNAQVSYNLDELKLRVDSVNRKLIIESLPNPDIKITPSVEISSVSDSFFNRIEQEDLQKIQNSAKEHAIKSVNRERLLREGKVQLIENLNQIFVLAKALNYEIEDQSGQIDVSKL